MTEAEAFHLAAKVRQLDRLIRRVESDYEKLVSMNVIKPIGGITEFEDVPVFLDLAIEITEDIHKITEDQLHEFD